MSAESATMEQTPKSLLHRIEALEGEIEALKRAAAGPIDHVDLTSPNGQFRLRVSIADYGHVEATLFVAGKQAAQRVVAVAARDNGPAQTWYLR